MKEMTSAEFKRANFEELTEPVAIKRYKDIRGYYYPVGQEPTEMTGIVPILESAGLRAPKPSLDIADMFRQIAKELREAAEKGDAIVKDLREIKQDTHCLDPLFHDHG